MRSEQTIAPLLALVLASCSCDQGNGITADEQPPDQHNGAHDRSVVAAPDLLAFDIMQQTCALYVAVRSSAWNRPIAFGGEMDDSMVHWNMCPGGTMVACVVAPTAHGDSVISGIPWPY